MIPARTLSVILLLVVMVIWGGTYVVTKSGLEELPPMLFALLRFCVASLVLVPIAWLRGGIAQLPHPVPWARLWLMALFGVGVYYIIFNLALTRTTASQGALVQSSIPVVTALMAIAWLGERVTAPRMLGIGLSMAGVLLIVARSAPDANARDPLTGNLLMFGSVLVWGAYTILAKQMAHAEPAVVTACVTVLGTVLLIPSAMIDVARGTVPALSLAGWFRLVYLGALASAVAYLFYSRALRDLDASQVGAFINLVPVIGVVTGVTFLGDTITPLALAGGALVLAGVWVSSRAPQATPEKPAGRVGPRDR